MKKIVLLLFIPFFLFGQTINKKDVFGNKQGYWEKKYKNGSIRYSGNFIDGSNLLISTLAIN